MSTQTSLQDMLEGPRLLAGEEHLRSSVPDLNSGEEPVSQIEKPEKQAAEKGEKQSATPAQADQKSDAGKQAEKDIWDDPDGETIPRGVYVATRNKWRQRTDETARELAELRGKLSAYQEQRPSNQQTQEQARPEDDDTRAYADPGKFAREVARNEAAGVRAELANAMHQMARRQLTRQHSDFAEAEQAFLDAAKQDRSLFVRMQAAVADGSMLHPEFAYETGKQLLRMQKLGASSLEELEAKLRKEAEEKAEEKYRKQSALDAAEQASTTSAGARGSGATSGPVFSGVTPLKAIVGKKRA